MKLPKYGLGDQVTFPCPWHREARNRGRIAGRITAIRTFQDDKLEATEYRVEIEHPPRGFKSKATMAWVLEENALLFKSAGRHGGPGAPVYTRKNEMLGRLVMSAWAGYQALYDQAYQLISTSPLWTDEGTRAALRAHHYKIARIGNALGKTPEKPPLKPRETTRRLADEAAKARGVKRH